MNIKAFRISLLTGLTVLTAALMPSQAQTIATSHAPASLATHRPEGPCDIYAAAGAPCVAAHSTTRALYAGYSGPLYQVLRQSDGKTLDIGIVSPGGFANSAAQDTFCANAYCWISKIYDQSGKHNDLSQAPRGGFSGPALGGFNNLPLADMAPVTLMGHKVYGVFIEPGMGLRQDDAKGTAVDDQAEGMYWVINGHHFNSGCCFDYGNAEIDSRDDDNGTMETAYFGDSPWWIHGNMPGPWIMTDQENNLVGCTDPDHNLCATLPDIPWRFVTAMAKGEPHRWESLGGDAQRGPLKQMADGHRVNATYDPMRKQGAILLGNGGDNSNGSQGTFYEGAVTAGGTFPSNETDQLVQANIVAAGYAPPRLSIAPASAAATAPGIQNFTPGSSQETTVTFTNTGTSPATKLRLSLAAPSREWTVALPGSSSTAKTFPDSVAPGATVTATFRITSGHPAVNADLVASAMWTDTATGESQSETTREKVRNTSPVKINEFRISSGSPANPTDSFIELYNAGATSVDISNWSLTPHPTQQAIFSTIRIPVGTHLAPGGFYLIGLANSGLAVPTRAGDKLVYLRSTTGMSAGDTVTIGDGPHAESRKISSLGTAATIPTTLWQPLPDGPVITLPAGTTNVPVDSTAGFVVGQKIALGYGATYPSVARDHEQYEIATVTSVGKAGTQAYLAADAPAGSNTIQVTAADNISVGDHIRLDIDSLGHGIETVTVTNVGTIAIQTNLAADATAGATQIKVRSTRGISVGSPLTVGTPATRQVVTVSAVSPESHSISITPALAQAHIRDEWVVVPGTGITLAEPLKFSHSANLPFSDRGTGISFTPATRFPHSSNEPIQALGTGVTLDTPLSAGYQIHTPVRDASVTTAGYQGTQPPNQWFGGPELATRAPLFGRIITIKQGSLLLRDAAGLVVDSLNYGGLVDPWAAQGYQAESGVEKSGCFAPAPGAGGADPFAAAQAVTASAGRFPDGADTGSNCSDFRTQATTTLATTAPAGSTNIKVFHVDGFHANQTIQLDSSARQESAVIAAVGTAGGTSLRMASQIGSSLLEVGNVSGFQDRQTITIGSGSSSETATIASTNFWGGATITLAAPLKQQHAMGEAVSGTGITLENPLAKAHDAGVSIADNPPTPGGPNRYSSERQ